jgi:hypothetical protein
MKYVLTVRACHNSTVSARRPSPVGVGALAVAALALTVSSCKKSGVECTPPPSNLTCPEAGAPSFSDVYQTVFQPVCNNCHAPDGSEAVMPLTTYAQIYGTNGMEAQRIFSQVFNS